MLIELRLIQHAQALGQHGNYARAAKSLNLTQPSISRSIAALERMLGVRLFDRSHKGVAPTVFGRLLLERSERWLRNESDLRREIGLLAGLVEGTLAVAAGPYVAETSVATAIARVARAHPGVRITFLSSDPAQVVSDVIEGRVDVGVADMAGLEKDIRLSVQALPARRVFLACRPDHPLTREASPTFARALEYPLVTTLLRGSRAAAAATRGAATIAEGPAVKDHAPQFRVNSLTLARLIARDSDALFPGTGALLAEDLAAGRLVTLSTDAPVLRTNPGVFHLRERTLAPAARVFIDVLSAVEEETREPAASNASPTNQDGSRARGGVRRAPDWGTGSPPSSSRPT